VNKRGISAKQPEKNPKNYVKKILTSFFTGASFAPIYPVAGVGTGIWCRREDIEIRSGL
jgi:hypothetical protein